MKALRRRAMLRGALGGVAVAVALPMLEVMLDSHGEHLADGADLPVRFMTWFFGNGMIPNRWVPAQQGSGWTPSQELAPLTALKDYVSVLSGFQNRCSQQITHHEGMTVFNGYSFVESNGDLYSKSGGPTIDQVIAGKIGAQTAIESVQLGTSKRLSVMDGGTTLHALSHKSTNQPLYPEFNPQKVWNTLFGSFTPENDPTGPLRVNVLDAVRESAADLKKRLGQKDGERLEAHLASVDALQKKIETIPPACDKPAEPSVTGQDVGGKEQLGAVHDTMADLLAYAFACDVTRVASMLFTGGAAETVFAEVGQSSVHHQNTHEPSFATEEIHDAVVFMMERFAYLLGRLQGTPDAAGGSLLDNIAIFCSSDCGEGWTHSIFDQPILVAGRGGGALTHPGIHYRSSNGENPSDILLSLLRVFDPSASQVGGGAPASTTPLGSILT